MQELRYAFTRQECGITDDPAQVIGVEWEKRLFEAIVSAVAQSVHRQGTTGAVTRGLNRIFTALDAAKDGVLRLERADVEILKGLFFADSAAVQPAQVRIFCLIQDEIERVLHQ